MVEWIAAVGALGEELLAIAGEIGSSAGTAAEGAVEAGAEGPSIADAYTLETYWKDGVGWRQRAVPGPEGGEPEIGGPSRTVYTGESGPASPPGAGAPPAGVPAPGGSPILNELPQPTTPLAPQSPPPTMPAAPPPADTGGGGAPANVPPHSPYQTPPPARPQPWATPDPEPPPRDAITRPAPEPAPAPIPPARPRPRRRPPAPTGPPRTPSAPPAVLRPRPEEAIPPSAAGSPPTPKSPPADPEVAAVQEILARDEKVGLKDSRKREERSGPNYDRDVLRIIRLCIREAQWRHPRTGKAQSTMQDTLRNARTQCIAIRNHSGPNSQLSLKGRDAERWLIGASSAFESALSGGYDVFKEHAPADWVESDPGVPASARGGERWLREGEAYRKQFIEGHEDDLEIVPPPTTAPPPEGDTKIVP